MFLVHHGTGVAAMGRKSHRRLTQPNLEDSASPRTKGESAVARWGHEIKRQASDTPGALAAVRLNYDLEKGMERAARLVD